MAVLSSPYLFICSHIAPNTRFPFWNLEIRAKQSFSLKEVPTTPRELGTKEFPSMWDFASENQDSLRKTR